MKRIIDIFDVQYGTQLDYNKMKTCDGKEGINFVSRTTKNNGVADVVYRLSNISPLKPGLITVALGGTGVLTSFVQDDYFYTAQNVAVLESKKDMSFREKMYYCVCIEKNQYRYSAFGREANKTLKDIKVPSRIPEWVHNIELTNYTHIDKSFSNKPIPKLNFWKQFKCGDLFNIRGGKGPTVRWAENNSGNTPFISAIDRNNGIRSYIDYEPTHKSNSITVVKNGSNVGKAFYQERPYCATGDILILTPKFKINVFIAMFLIVIINKEQYRFNHARKWTIQRMENNVFNLPATQNGEPDWNKMEQYIKSLKFSKYLDS